MSVSRTASAAEPASLMPALAPACLSVSPSGAENKISQAATRSSPPSRKPNAIACPASPKPIRETRGVLRRFIGLLVLRVRHAVGVERLDGLQAPSLALLALLFGPGDRLPIRRQDEPGAGIRH